MKAPVPRWRSALAAAVLTVVALGVAFCPQPAHADATIDGLRYFREGDLLLVAFRLQGAFTDKIVEAIDSGAPATFRYNIRLYRHVPNLVDDRVISFQIERTIRYDTLTQKYRIASNGQRWLAGSRVEAERLMTELLDVPVAHISKLDPSFSYFITVKAELADLQLPFVTGFLRYLFTPWNFETGWVRIKIASGSIPAPPEVKAAPEDTGAEEDEDGEGGGDG